MPLLRQGRIRKRWRYLAVYEERVLLCAARVEVGPLQQSFWAVWDRERRVRLAHTSFLRGRNEVRIAGPGDRGPVNLQLEAAGASADLSLGESIPIESVCPSGERGYAWTRKRAGMPVEGSVTLGGRTIALNGAHGVDDASAGYHQRHTDWLWSAGVGRSRDGRDVAWNLVAGINDPPRGSERAVWVDGQPDEPDPVSFDGVEGVAFAGGEQLRFSAESERARDDNLLVFRSRYRHLFGTFAGTLPGIELEHAFGVMEEHSAKW
jgi:hypothetical protein